jgi:hypothetical protein
MKSTKHAPLALILMAVLNACGESDRSTPLAPSPPVAPSPSPNPSPGPSPRGPGTGTIAIRELSPAPGTELAVQSHCAAGSVTRMCTDQWRGTFDVMVDREMTNAVLTVGFYDGQTKCGYGAKTLEIVPAGERVSFSVGRIVFSDEFGTFAQPCPLPATTNRIEVELWSDLSTWTNTLVQVFEQSYRFSAP